jgi:hypothetical protein
MLTAQVPFQWTDHVLMTRRNQLNKAYVKYLESRLIARNRKRNHAEIMIYNLYHVLST